MSNNFDFTDLVLLVGTNPLPNYVVGKYFSMNNRNLKRILLIYSEKTELSKSSTKQYADDIRAVLAKKLDRNIEIKKEAISDVSSSIIISSEIRNILSPDNFGYEVEKIHLNYTGGTKAMSVHVYRELEEMWKYRFSASYLNARDFKIKFDNNQEYYSTEDLRETIDISWDDLFHLHNCKISNKGGYFETLNSQEKEKIINNIVNLINKGKIMELKEWIQKFKSLNDKKKYNKISLDLINKEMEVYNNKRNKELFSLLASFPKDCRPVDEDGNWVYDNILTRRAFNENLIKFLDGKWLDSYVYQIIKTKKPESEPYISCELKTREDAESKPFEVDIILKNGYQICGISCGTTVSDKSRMKNKGFEVILRSRQIGGEEARAILVTLLDKINLFKFERDLKASAGPGHENFIVLGMDDLPPDRLWGKIEKHVFEEVV